MNKQKKMIIISTILFFFSIDCAIQQIKSSVVPSFDLSELLASNSTSAMNALKIEQERQLVLDASDERSVKEIENQITPNIFTQSQAHLHLRNVRELIAKEFGGEKTGSNKVTPYINIIFSALAREAKNKDEYVVFYHATSTKWVVASDLFTQLYAYFNPGQNVSEFKFLRFSGESTAISPQQFLVEEIKENGLINDLKKEKSDIMLAANLALFGNVGFINECTWSYFLGSKKRGVPDAAIYLKIMKQFGLTEKYIKEMMALEDLIFTDEYSLVQIFIPKNLVDSIAYLSWTRGIPAHSQLMQWFKDNMKTKEGLAADTTKVRETLTKRFKQGQEEPLFRNVIQDIEQGAFSIESFLKVYCNKPEALPWLNNTAARIFFTSQGLLNPESGVKFYRYLATARQKLQEYNRKRDQIVRKIIDDYEKVKS